MLTVIEQRTYEAICSLATALEKEVPKVVGQLERIADVLKATGSSDTEWRPKQDPAYCMDFDEWAERLDFEDRRRLMNFLWNDKDWHATCLREEDCPWEDWDKSHPDTPPEPPLCGDDDDLPF